MTQRYSFASADLMNEPAVAVGRIRQDCRSTSIVMRVAQALWPRKPAAELSARTGSSIRACERWLGGQYNPSLDAYAGLLRSEDGYAFLEGMMGDAKPQWWLDFQHQHQCAALRRQLSQLQSRLKELERDG